MTKRQSSTVNDADDIYDPDEIATTKEILSGLYSFGHIDDVHNQECAVWLEMSIAVDQNSDFQPLLDLLQSGRQAPAAIMPYVRDLFERRGLIKGVRGDKRRTPLYQKSHKEVSLMLACDDVKQLIEHGMKVDEAITLIAKQSGINPTTLENAYKQRRGSTRRIQARQKSMKTPDA